MNDNLSFICANCGAIATTDETALDNGSVLVCNKCGGETVIRLLSVSSLLTRAPRPCRPKRLEWNIGPRDIFAMTQMGRFAIDPRSDDFFLVGFGGWWHSAPTLEAAKVAAQAHFDSVWREMTDCDDEPKRGPLVLRADLDATVIARPAAGEPGRAIIMFYSDGKHVQVVVDNGQLDDLAHSAVQIFKRELREKMRTMLDNEPEALKESTEAHDD